MEHVTEQLTHIICTAVSCCVPSVKKVISLVIMTVSYRMMMLGTTTGALFTTNNPSNVYKGV